jgi:uncharacterized membrane protein
LKILKIILAVLLFAALSYFTWLMIQSTLPYFSMESDVRFLRIKNRVTPDGSFNYLENPVRYWAFYLHVFTSCVLLFAGFTQFSKKILKQIPLVHRFAGWIYIVVLILISGPSGFIMGIYANGGTYSVIAFLMLSAIWIFSTSMALYTVYKKNYKAHRNWMIISYALTLSALTLRAWSYFIKNHWIDLGFEAIRPMDIYRVVAWLGWVPNFLFALMLVWYKRNKKI